MNKLLSFIAFTLISTPLFGCNKYDGYKGLVPTRKCEYLDSYVRLESAKEVNDIVRYDPAILMVTNVGCHYCQQQYIEINAFVKETHTLIYAIDSSIYYELRNASYNLEGEYASLYPSIAGTPTYLFFKDGKLNAKYDGAFDVGMFSTRIYDYIIDVNLYTVNDFKKGDGDTYYLKDIYEDKDIEGLNTSYLDSLIDKKRIIMFTWRRCIDCKNYQQNVLNKFLNTYKDVSIYYYEVDGYYQLKRDADEEDRNYGLNLWSNFAKKYHLTDYQGIKDKNDNDSGVVPTIIYDIYGERKVSVYANDGQIYRNDKGRLQYGLSFYDDVKKLESKTIVDENDNTSTKYQKALKELSSKAMKIENKKCLDFLVEVSR